MSIPFIFWRRALIYTHRWLGIAGSLLFVVWFASGIVLMYAGMPALDPAERLARAPAVDLSAARLDVGEAAVRAGFTPARILVGMHGDRPVYRFAGGGGWTTIYADTGETAGGLGPEQALEVARRFMPEHAATARYDARLTAPDQWTLQSGAFFPLHRVPMGDAAGTVLYVSDRTVEPILETTRRGRLWAWLGAVPHWLYFTPLRSRAGLWSDVVIGLSILGCLLALSGIVWGLWRLSVSTAYRLRGRPSRSPYAGLMRWHHYAGLVFGVFAFTWVFSGGLSMDPWSWHPGTGATPAQRQALAGGPPRLGPLTADGLRAGAAAIGEWFEPRELEVVQLANEPHVLALDPAATVPEDLALPTTLATLRSQVPEQRLVSMLHPEGGAFIRFGDDRMEAMAAAAMPGASIEDAAWIRAYDDYYYDRGRRLPLPVLRVRYDDPGATWLYLDPYRGAVARKEERLTRLNRWLYRGLHGLDFPFLYSQRPLWDAIVIGLSLGGILVSVTSAAQGWRRLRRHVRRLRPPAQESAP